MHKTQFLMFIQDNNTNYDARIVKNDIEHDNFYD